MTSVEYLDLEELLGLVRALGAGPVRDPGLLDAACARSRSTVLGEDAHPTLKHEMATLLHSLARNHALVGGNKRLSWLAAPASLDINGSSAELPDDEGFALVISVVVEVGEIAARLNAE